MSIGRIIKENQPDNYEKLNGIRNKKKENLSERDLELAKQMDQQSGEEEDEMSGMDLGSNEPQVGEEQPEDNLTDDYAEVKEKVLKNKFFDRKKRK